MTTDDTAKAILEHPLKKVLLDKADAESFAKLWLMRDEILAVMSDAGSSMHGCSQQFFDVEKRLQALEVIGE